MVTSSNRSRTLELRHLVSFAAVVRERSFARAAEKLGYTHAAVSQQISSLERSLGTPLLRRRPGNSPLGTTEAGAVLLKHADRITATLQAVEADFAALAAGTAGMLRVGTFQTVGMSFLPELLARFRRQHPAVTVEIDELRALPDLLARTATAELDLTFTELPVDEDPFDSIELMTDPFVLVVPADGALARRGHPLGLAEISLLPLIAYKVPSTAERAVIAAGVHPNVIHRSNETATVHGFVAAGLGVGLLPRLALNPRDQRVRALSLPDFIAPRRIGLTWQRERFRSASSRAFQALAVEVCRDYATTRHDRSAPYGSHLEP